VLPLRPCALVATDLGAAADVALVQAAAWAQAHRARLVVCRVLPHLLPSDPLLPHLNQQLALEAADVRRRLGDEVAARAQALGVARADFDVVVQEGVVYAVVVELAERLGARLVAVGRRGRLALDSLTQGGVAVKVVRFAHASVWVAGDAGDGPVVVGTDFSESAERAVSAAADEARRLAAPLFVAHAIDLAPTLSERAGLAFGAPEYTLPQRVERTLREAVGARLAALHERAALPGDTRVLDGSPADALVALARETRARLLVVGTLGRTGLRRLVLGSVAERVAIAADCPVLVVRPGVL
jgi:nucleotide-binding universal stress UspA family protein